MKKESTFLDLAPTKYRYYVQVKCFGSSGTHSMLQDQVNKYLSTLNNNETFKFIKYHDGLTIVGIEIKEKI